MSKKKKNKKCMISKKKLHKMLCQAEIRGERDGEIIDILTSVLMGKLAPVIERSEEDEITVLVKSPDATFIAIDPEELPEIITAGEEENVQHIYYINGCGDEVLFVSRDGGQTFVRAPLQSPVIASEGGLTIPLSSPEEVADALSDAGVNHKSTIGDQIKNIVDTFVKDTLNEPNGSVDLKKDVSNN